MPLTDEQLKAYREVALDWLSTPPEELALAMLALLDEIEQLGDQIASS